MLSTKKCRLFLSPYKAFRNRVMMLLLIVRWWLVTTNCMAFFTFLATQSQLYILRNAMWHVHKNHDFVNANIVISLEKLSEECRSYVSTYTYNTHTITQWKQVGFIYIFYIKSCSWIRLSFCFTEVNLKFSFGRD